MKKKLKTTIALFLSMAVAGCLLSCSDWTKPEPLDIEYPVSAENANTFEYQEYLERLRAYKKTYHPLMIGVFDNSDKSFRSRVSRLTDLPDKVDIVSLLYPDNLTDTEMKEIESVRKNKGTGVIYSILWEQLRKEIEEDNFEISLVNIEEEALGVPLTPLRDIVAETAQFMNEQAALLDKYGYDGFIVYYDGKSTDVMTGREIEEMRNVQNIIMGKVNDVRNANPDKIFIFEGRPQNLLNKSNFQMFDYFLFRTHVSDVASFYDISAFVRTALEDPHLPRHNILISAPAHYIDEYGNELGQTQDANGSLQSAIVTAAHWVKTTDTFTKAGMVVYMINNDYFNPDVNYKNVLEAINIMNP